jgi:hypothetical protein
MFLLSTVSNLSAMSLGSLGKLAWGRGGGRDDGATEW